MTGGLGTPSARHEPPVPPPNRKTAAFLRRRSVGLLTRPGAQADSRWGVWSRAWKARLARRRQAGYLCQRRAGRAVRAALPGTWGGSGEVGSGPPRDL